MMRSSLELSFVTLRRFTTSDGIAFRSWQRHHSHWTAGSQRRRFFSLGYKSIFRPLAAHISWQQKYRFCTTSRRDASDTDFGILISETIARHPTEMVLVQVGNFYEVSMLSTSAIWMC